MNGFAWAFLVAAVVVGAGAAWLCVELRRAVRARDLALSGRDDALRARDEADRAASEARVRLESAAEQLRGERVRFEAEIGVAAARADASTTRVVELSEQLAAAKQQLADMEGMRQELAKNEQRLKEAFGSLSAEALKASREEFLTQARPVFEAARKEQSELVKPIGETLKETREHLVKLNERVANAGELNRELREETERLTRALSRPEVRGQYGEIQLRRVAELAGMTSYCDFCEQESVRDSDGNLLRPDMVVRLPNERVIAVDAKTNTFAYLEAVNAKTDDERERHMARFAGHVLDQAKKLGDKRYWSRFAGSPEFVVMFVPGDCFIDAALERKPELMEFAAERGVILASPSTLIGLLRAVAVGWREHSLSEQAKELFELGKELHERARVAFEKIDELGTLIGRAGKKYNEVVGSIDSRLVPTLRKFEEAGAKGGKPVAELTPVETEMRSLLPGE